MDERKGIAGKNMAGPGRKDVEEDSINLINPNTLNTLNKSEKRRIKFNYDEHSCGECGGNNVDNRMYKAFGIKLCKPCSGDINLISQGAAQEKFLLSKADLRRLNHMEVPNPISSGWKPMLLYLEQEVEQLSKEKHKDIEQEKIKRKKRITEIKQNRIKKKISELKRKVNVRIEREEKHEHVFNSNGECICGMKVEQEDI